MLKLFPLCLLILELIQGGWIDPDSLNYSVNTTKSYVDGSTYALVFSDEFNTNERNFVDGSDPRWTAVNKNDYTNFALHYYNSDLASTSNGYLNISTVIEDVTFTVEEMGHSRQETKNYQSAMVQGWDKFCFTGGVVEISAKLPGSADIGGLWPAMWLLGNLARATYVSSSNNVWPWSFDTCDPSLQHEQLISACNAVNHFDLHSHQGRGAPEVDILEAMPGREKLINTPVNKPYFSTSLQVVGSDLVI
jgi:beta-glucanase (GH16 family)